eukprot:TRINITY_DN7386_c0_g1_i1.p1 TRINITY_DN7386_c0_g1~~TRINITY_DN7386_c0_g1_i1.p1  ORF type:complete len:323 (-),score=65.48 TRINITY_DN7386_c0_g1_i1:15-983(-)
MEQKFEKLVICGLVFVLIQTFYWFWICRFDIPLRGKYSVRIVSYNLKYAYSDCDNWFERRDLLVSQILSLQPDSIGVQEADEGWMNQALGLPFLLRANYSYVGVGREDGKNKGEMAAIFYLKRKYRVLHNDSFWLSETPDIPSKGWDAIDYRICSYVQLQNIETNEVYTHYNTHFEHKSKIAPIKSAEMVIQKIFDDDEDCIYDFHNFVLTGDFNFGQESKKYKIFEKSPLIFDSKKIAIDSMNHGTLNFFVPLNYRYFQPIDFIFVSRRVTVLSYRVDTSVWSHGLLFDLPVSDHFPVIVDLLFHNLENRDLKDEEMKIIK